MTFFVSPIEHTCEAFYPFPVQPHGSCPRARSLAWNNIAMVVFEKGMQNFLLLLSARFFPVEGESKCPSPARSPIIGTLSLCRIWRKIYTVLDVIAHISPEIVVDTPFFFFYVECCLSFCLK